jgi:hypothetical protein
MDCEPHEIVKAAPFSIRVRLTPVVVDFSIRKSGSRDGQNCSLSSFERLPGLSCGGKTQDWKRIQVSYIHWELFRKVELTA